MGIWHQNVRFAIRQLQRNPGFTLTVVLTLSLSIGANTAIFSVLNALMLRSLPYSHPERMGTIYTRVTGPTPSDERHHLNGEQWELLRDRVPSLISAVSSTGTMGINFRAGSKVQYLHAGRVSAHYFDVLDVRPIIGQSFSEDDDRPNGPKAVVLSYELWRNSFNANPDIVGAPVQLKGEPYTVIGVLPQGTTTPLNADLYTSLQASREGEGGGTNFEAITRLRDGSNWQQADGEIKRAWALRSQRYELSNSPGADVTYYSVPLQKGQSAELRPQVLTLMVAAGCILLIACANLAGLMMVKLLRRSPEFATRLALGASPWQIQKQLWSETLLLAVMGGVAGVAVGGAALRGLLFLLPEYFLPVKDISLDVRVWIFAILVTLLTSVLFGMLPALSIRRTDLRSAISIRESTRGDRLGLRQALIVGEVALTVLLLAGAGLLIRTLVHLQTLPPGFDANGVMTAKASLNDVRYHDTEAFQKLLNESIAAMRQIPGVQHAAVGLSVPYERSLNSGVAISDGKEAGRQVMTGEVYITPEYFAALRIPLLAGRAFAETDGANSQHVAIVNRTFARKFFHGENPVGRHVDKDTLIVGMVGDVAIPPGLDPTGPLVDEEEMYIPAAQVEAAALSLLHVWFQPSWIVRTASPVEGLTAQMQRALATVDPNLPFSGFYRMRDLLAKTLAVQRIEVALLSTMACLALVLSTVGLFGLVANIIAQRTREIGIRIALGSTIHQAMLNVGTPGIVASALGLALGSVLCLAGLRVLRSVIFGVQIFDALTIIGVLFTLTCTTVIATVVPTMRVARIDPAETLRVE